MKMTNTLLYIIAVLGAVLSGIFYFLTEGNKQDLEGRLSNLQSSLQAQKAESQSLLTRSEALEKSVAEKEKELEEARSNNAVLTARSNQLKRETRRFSDELDQRIQKEENLQSTIADLNKRIVEIRATTVDVSEVAQYQNEISKMEAEILRLRDSQRSFPGSTASQETNVKTAPANLKGKILTVGPQSSFVVVNMGYNSGIRLSHGLNIRRGGEQIAQLQVTEVKENLSIAHILPESLSKDPMAGDIVTSN